MNHSELSERYSALDHSLAEYADSTRGLEFEQHKQNLITRFLKLGVVSVLLGSLLLCLLFSIFLQHQELNRIVDLVDAHANHAAKLISSRDNLTSDRAHRALLTVTRDRLNLAQSIAVFDSERKRVAEFGSQSELADVLVNSGLSALNPTKIVSPSALNGSMLLGLLTSDYPPVIVASLVPLQGKRASILASIDNSSNFSDLRVAAILLLIASLLLSCLVFFCLYKIFLKSLDTIDKQEVKLNSQIAKLSNLLEVNKSMQKSIRSASARAVELNEQFLRRTGADLHDGPAQMIGFSVMRLNMAIEKDESNLISPEFHAIKQALEESLEEIRGISSGLVLPQLETMTLEQCMAKVVLLHTAAHPTEVEEIYSDIDHDVALPIKICAYRMVQEGLNNAHRHGQARLCRLKVFVKNDVLQIVLKDNGIGFRKSQLSNDGKHLGLIGLKDRIESLGGKLSINSELGVGTSLKLTISLS